MVFGPTRGDEFSQLLADGRAEGAAGALTVTEERARLVDFSQPFATEVNEVVITGPVIPPGTGFDALAATEIHVRPSTRSEEHTSDLPSLIPFSFSFFCFIKYFLFFSLSSFFFLFFSLLFFLLFFFFFF